MRNSLLAFVACLPLFYGCATPPQERIILLPQADGSQSAVVVTSKDKSLVLEQPYDVAKVGGEKRIEAEKTDAATVAQRYRDVTEALPPRPRSYTLNFVFGKSQLTRESQILLDSILREMEGMQAPEIIIIGHADDVGGDAVNDKLSEERANSVLKLIRAKGIAVREVSVVGRGKREPLVESKRGVPEPRNRRVEIRLK